MICHVNLAKGFRGGERQTSLLVAELQRRGQPQAMLVRRDSGLSRRMHGSDGLSMRMLNGPALFHLNRCRDCRLIHAHEAKAGHFAYLAGKLLDIPYIITRRVPNRPKDNRFTRAVYRNAARVVAISTAIRNVLLDYDPTLRIDVIPSMLSRLPSDQAAVTRLRAQFADKFVVGHVGALVNHHKGQAYIIEAAKRLRETHPQLHFVLVGSGADEAWLKEQATGLENITFTGFVDNVGDYLACFDLFVFPSLEEGLGSVLLDVMDFGVPIVASGVDGIPDIVHHGENGLLIPPRDSQQLRDAIVELYDRPDLRQRFAEQGKRVVAGYRPEVLAEPYLKLYSEILGSA